MPATTWSSPNRRGSVTSRCCSPPMRSRGRCACANRPSILTSRRSRPPSVRAPGWCYPNAVMQYALPDLERLSIDQTALARRRDRLTSALAAAGYGVLPPEGTFYLWARWPEGDSERHWNALADRDVFVMPGSLLG